MSNELTVGIIGLYTVVYVIVFFVQKSQIDQTKEINASIVLPNNQQALMDMLIDHEKNKP